MSDNRHRSSGFTKQITGFYIKKDISDKSEETPYLADISYKLEYVYEKSVYAVKSNWDTTDNASKRFKTEEEAKAWLVEKGVEL